MKYCIELAATAKADIRGQVQWLRADTVPFCLMPRTGRLTSGGMVYHVLNRSVGRMHMFRKDADFAAFQRVMIEAYERQPIRILSYCVIGPNWTASE